MQSASWSEGLINRTLFSFLVCLLSTVLAVTASGQTATRKNGSGAGVAPSILLRIIKAEDERRWDNELLEFFTSPSAAVRKRAVLAAGRIGNEAAIPALADLLRKDSDPDVRSMASFAIGEVESAKGAEPLIEIIKDKAAPASVRARAVEGLGKIAAALPKEQEARERELAAIILDELKSQTSAGNQEAILLGLTAVLRSRPAGAGPVVAGFLQFPDARVRADVANVLARLRLKDGNPQLLVMLKKDSDAVVRANAARVLGITEEKGALNALLESATGDPDSRVRVSAIRSIGSLKDSGSAKTLLARGESLIQVGLSARPPVTNEVLEIATALGRLIPASENQSVLSWLHKVSTELEKTAPEVEIAFARIGPAAYLSEFGKGEAGEKDLQRKFILNWRSGAGIAAGLGEIATTPDSISNRDELKQTAVRLLEAMLAYREPGVKINSLLPLHTEYGVPDVLRAFSAHKPKNLSEVLLQYLQDNDVIVRATAADLLGDLQPSEVNERALAAALPRAFSDELNDAVLSILDSLAKQKTSTANEAIKKTLDASDYLVRRRAVALLKQNGAGDFSSRIGTVKTRNTAADYRRALSRVGKNVSLAVTTTKGSFTMELLPSEAPLTVDNFVQLAQRGYFNGITVHRVVANFVVQDGDPRGDGNGGPGYAIRCEINEVPFDRAVVGMALSGKDTGGSQWFITHSPQPHLDGGYTVFGRVVKGMDVVDNIVRGDVIKSVKMGRN